MTFLLEKNLFLKKLENLLPVVSGKNDIFFNIKKISPSQLQIFGKGAEVSIFSYIEPVEIKNEFDLTLPFHPIFQLLNQITDEFIEVEEVEEKLVIKCNNGVYKYNTYNNVNVEEVSPKIPDFFLDKSLFKKLFEAVEFSCAKEASRFSMNGIYFSFFKCQIMSAGTDGRRLAVSKFSTKNQFEQGITFLLPHKTIGSIVKNSITGNEEKIGFKIKEKTVEIFDGSTQIVIQKIIGNFPEIENVIPKNSLNRVSGKLDVFRRLIKQILIFTENDYPIVTLTFKGNELFLNSSSKKTGQCNLKMDIELIGEGGEIAFNPKFLLDGLNHSKDANFCFEFNSSDSPGLLELGQGVQYIMMPVTKI